MERRIRLTFNRHFYSAAAVRQAVADYRDVADFQVTDTQGAIAVFLYNFNADVAPRLADEFSNYILSLEATRSHGKTAGNT